MPSHDMSAAQSLGPYRILRPLGEGGMGAVFLCHDPFLDRHVAVKLLRPADKADVSTPIMVKRFLREARSAAKLNHPHVVTIYAVGQIDSHRPYIAMEYIDGGSLADHLRTKGPLPWPDATRAIRDALLALEAAHDAGIIHRDLKPANLMRTTTGITKLVDFGLARIADSAPTDPDLTFPGAFVGSPSYASPEQISGRLLDPRADLYSLAATWFTLIAGHPPYLEDDPADVMRRHLTARFPDLRTFTDVPTPLLQILERASRPLPDDRYKNARQMRLALEPLLTIPCAPHKKCLPKPNPILAEIENQKSKIENPLHADSTTQLAALRSLFSLYIQLDRRDDATRVFREALVLHVRMNAPSTRSLN